MQIELKNDSTLMGLESPIEKDSQNIIFIRRLHWMTTFEPIVAKLESNK
jgi:hypothetical protein